ncbi:hypothetical protein Acr_06g0005350 [Actinidia rufa]|uniref:Disease resistance protein At4g27190-like leucine-rich repeats domain-containing protein n=1 Tax=Actinidia rufa TaxID=165716 RepID=A0A7J0EQ33_9ERIC|nr:hypothetical protein Acr_06g0005350 [Actinidia rufa]
MAARRLLRKKKSSVDKSDILTKKANMKADREEIAEEVLDRMKRYLSPEAKFFGGLKHNRWERMTQEVEFLSRKKDFLLLILSYPMERDADVDINRIKLLTDTFSKINRFKRELPPLTSDSDYGIHINELFGKVIVEIMNDFLRAETTLANYDFSMVAYLPQKNDKIGSSRKSLKQRIEDGLRHRTSGSGGEEVASRAAVIDRPRIRAKCSVVLRVSVSRHYSIKEIDLHDLKLPPHGYVVLTTQAQKVYEIMEVDLECPAPPEIGALGKLEVLDLEGTEIMHLPKEIGELFSLRGFKVSLCGYRKPYGETEQVGTTIPTEVLSKFSQLEELSIDVIPDGDWWDADVNPASDWWDADVNVILNELSSSKKLRILKLYLPSTELLQQLRWDGKQLMYQDLSRFRFTVGRHQQRIIYRLPHEVEERFNKWEEEFKKCLKYINGEGVPLGITEALKHASVFFLDRHWTVKALSEFKHENMVKLECCLLVECNELQTIIDGNYEYPSGVDKKSVFGLLRNLSIHYMKNLQSIWKGPIDKNFLSNLRSLALHTCPNLITIFTPDLLGNLRWLEELIVEDCPQNQEPRKTGIFLVDFRIGLLVDLIVYNCPKLKSLYATEWSQKYYYKIKGEKEWWDSLKWHNPEWSRMTRPYYEEMDEDFMDQSAKDVYLN